MLNEFERYAVYWVPRRPDPLGAFGDAWTGWCAEGGEHRARCDFPGLRDLTRRLCRHGLHGVIRAPFRLAPGRSSFAIEHALDEIAEETVSVRLPYFRLAVVRGRVALVPARGSDPLAALVARVEGMLAPLARPTSPCAARAAASDAPVVAIDTDEHRFHLPLTDRLPLEEAHAVKEALAPVVRHLLATPRVLSAISLMGDPGEGRPFRVLENYALLDSPLRPGAQALPSHGPQVLTPMFEMRRKSDVAV